MADQYSDSRTHLSKTDAFIEDYLSDVWGDSHVLKHHEDVDKAEHIAPVVKENAAPLFNSLKDEPTTSAIVSEQLSCAQEQKLIRQTLPVDKIQVKQIVRIPKNVLVGGRPTFQVAPIELIQKQFSLVPTIKLSSASQAQTLRTQTESIIILLTNLYFLRRPLPPKVRRYILNLSEQVIDDFHAAVWLRGITHEV